jgi:DNA-binding PadR family transcriptional regulator
MPIESAIQSAANRPLILAILSKREESYGYEIIQLVKQLSDGSLEWKDGMLYPVLHKMEKEGLIRSTWKIAENGRRRKYYSITADGKRALASIRSQWLHVHQILTTAWNPELRLT